MDLDEHHMLGDSAEHHHSLGDSVVDMFGDGISRRAYDFAERHPYLTAGAVGAGVLAGSIALAPELSVAGIGAGAGELATMAGYGDRVLDATNYARLAQTGAAMMGII